MLNRSEDGPGASKFPLGLLAAGYGTAGIAAFLASVLGGPTLAVVLTFWFGGAMATLAWGAIWISCARPVDRPSEHAAQLAISRPLPVSAK